MPKDPATGAIRLPVWVYAAACGLALLALPWIGAENLCWRDVVAFLKGANTAHGQILFLQRIPRVLLAVAVGGALSMTGATLQVLFRNPLAEPWTLGVAGGAAIGAFIAHAFPALALAVGPLNTSQAFALLGAGAVMGLLFVFAHRGGGGRLASTLLLAGVTINVVTGGAMMLVAYFISPFELAAFYRWMMGGLDVVGYRELSSFLVLGGPGLAILAVQARAYNHMALGEDMALGHGVDVAAVQRWTLVGAGLTTAACVALAGPIGFVGMIVPHVVRRLSGFDNRIVLPAAFLLGGAVLAACDGVARSVIAPTEIPVGIITAVAGGPIFLYLLGRR